MLDELDSESMKDTIKLLARSFAEGYDEYWYEKHCPESVKTWIEWAKSEGCE